VSCVQGGYLPMLRWESVLSSWNEFTSMTTHVPFGQTHAMRNEM
jgi:hypothetical protein